jgi:protein-S-isoprenylcysteine O-methyltransferase Ste14
MIDRVAQVFSTIEPSQALFLIALYCIGFVSYVFYRTDRAAETYAGKSQKIPSIRGAGLMISLSFYATILISTLAVFYPHPAFLVLWNNELIRVAGVVLAVLGISIFVAAKVQLGRNYTPCFRSFGPIEVVAKGIYRFVRHPIYVGNSLIFFGAFLSSGSLWIGSFAVSLLAIYIRTARIEEVFLSGEFEEYRRYTERTGGFFPRLTAVQSAPQVSLAFSPLEFRPDPSPVEKQP